MFDIMMDALNIEDYDTVNKKCCCPFHSEDTPSFIYNPKTGSAHCFGSCGRNYDLIDIYLSQGLTYIESVQKLFELSDTPYAFGEHGIKTRTQYNYPHEVICDNKDRVYKYLKSRKISDKTADYLDIRQDENGNCVFNYYDLNDTLTMVKYRPSHKVAKSEPKNWCQPGADTLPLLYNMNRINTQQPLLICSGELDCAAAIEAGWLNAVSIPLGDQNTRWVDENFDWLEEFSEIIICPDNDDSGQKYCKNIVPRLGSWRCKIAQVPDGCKDINEALFRLGSDKVLDFIVHAVDTPVPSVIDFAEISERDISDMDGVKTGVTKLDADIGSLFFGSFNIMSGYPGAGKTSALYGMVCNAIDSGINTFVYSRELPEWMSKNWILHMLSGIRNHEKKDKADGSSYYKVTTDAIKKINQFYKGRLFFYRDDYPNDVESLFDSMTSSVRKYGSKLVLIDNLMTVDLGGTDENKYERQTQFINRLIEFATKYQVAVVLVCHPNKQSDTTQSVGMYQISGSSNLINLAHRAFGLRRITKREKDGYVEGRTEFPPNPYDVTLNIIKDRFGGKTQCEYNMFYDEISRRFYANQDEYDKRFSWDTKTYTTKIVSQKLEDVNDDEVFGEGDG